MASVGLYDGSLQMFVVHGSVSRDRLRFMRWLVSTGRLRGDHAGPTQSPAQNARVPTCSVERGAECGICEVCAPFGGS